MELNVKICINALHGERINRLSKEERQKIVNILLESHTQRQLALILGIPKSTIHDWATLRQDNTGEHIHISLSLILRKIKNLKPIEITDWGRLEQIKKEIERLLRLKN